MKDVIHFYPHAWFYGLRVMLSYFSMLGLLVYHVIRLKTCTPLSSMSMLGWLKPNSLKFQNLPEQFKRAFEPIWRLLWPSFIYKVWQYQLWSFKLRDIKLKKNCLKVKGFKGFFDIFWNEMMASLHNLGLFLQNKLFETWIKWKITDKKCNLNGKKIPRISYHDRFWLKYFEIRSWKSKFPFLSGITIIPF